MTVFKTYLKILRKNLVMVLVFSIMLVIFGGLRMSSEDKSLSFNAVKPDVLIVNKDEEKGITKGFIKYIKANSNIQKIANNEDARNDALFYNEVDYIIYIPKGFNEDFMNGNIEKIEVKKGNNFNGSYSEMMINRYLKIASTYRTKTTNQDELVKIVDKTLKNNTKIEITTKLDTDRLEAAEFFYNFESYSILVCLIFIISLIQTIFNEEKIRKRTVISSTSYKKNNRILLLCNLLYALTVWVAYLILAIFMLGDILWTSNGILYIINSFVHLITVTSLAFLIGNLVTNKDVVNGVTNVVGLGTSFLCGVFVPLEYLPDGVIKMAHLLPTYYYVKSNTIITTLEEININTLKPVLINMSILLGSAIVFIILSNIVSNRKRKIG